MPPILYTVIVKYYYKHIFCNNVTNNANNRISSNSNKANKISNKQSNKITNKNNQEIGFDNLESENSNE